MTRTSAKGMLQSIAEQAGCSPSTVSRVLNGCKKGFSVKRELEERILAIANSLDYHPNPFLRVMRANDSKIIAIFDPATNSSETLHKAKAAFIGCIRQAGYLDTGKYVSLYNQESYTLPFPVAAALLFDISDTSFLAFLERREIPYVVINGISREGGAAIRHDEAQNVRTAIDYLAATGHRRIVYAKTAYDTPDCHARLRAYRDAHASAGLPVDEELIYCKPLREIDTPELVETFLDDVLPLRPDALLLGNPTTIGFCLKQLRKRGLAVPGDLSIVGMDDWPTAEAFTPEIAAISNNYDAVAERAVEIITRNQKLDQPELIQEYIPGAFIERGSCIPTRKA